MEKRSKCLAVIRVRGVSDIYHEISDTLKMLHLTRNCNATIIDDRSAYLGMLKKAKDYITWGEISKENLLHLLKKRGRLVGNKKVTDKYAQRIGYASLNDLVEAVHNLEVEYKRLSDIKPVFRLHPPKKGYKAKVKRSFAAGGVTGYRGEAINDIIKRMT